MVSATVTGSDINLVIAWGRLESAVQFLKTSHVPETYDESSTVHIGKEV